MLFTAPLPDSAPCLHLSLGVEVRRDPRRVVLSTSCPAAARTLLQQVHLPAGRRGEGEATLCTECCAKPRPVQAAQGSGTASPSRPREHPCLGRGRRGSLCFICGGVFFF